MSVLAPLAHLPLRIHHAPAHPVHDRHDAQGRRSGGYDVLTSAECKQALKDDNVVLVTWGEIRKAMYPTP